MHMNAATHNYAQKIAATQAAKLRNKTMKVFLMLKSNYDAETEFLMT